ncbi:MAG: hypothetical protein ACYDH5_15715 [Acidimicrobiales bacterium]
MSGMERRPAAATPAERGAPGTPAVPAGPARHAWGEPGVVGWALLPEAARGSLAEARICSGDGVAAWADDAGVRRRGDVYAQYVEGWWADEERFVTMQSRRSLDPEAPGSRRFRPNGRWSATAIVHDLIAVNVERQRWRRPGTTGGGSGALTEPRYVPDVMDLLPAAVKQRIGRPTVRGAVRYHLSNGLRERIVAYRRDGERVVVLAAERSATAFPDPETALDAAAWATTFIEAALGPARATELSPPARSAAVGVPRLFRTK